MSCHSIFCVVFDGKGIEFGILIELLFIYFNVNCVNRFVVIKMPSKVFVFFSFSSSVLTIQITFFVVFFHSEKRRRLEAKGSLVGSGLFRSIEKSNSEGRGREAGVFGVF